MDSESSGKKSINRIVGVIALLICHWCLAISSVREKAATCDEVVHLTGGYTYWKLNDYRINPENGSLPQRWAAAPLLWGEYRFPSSTGEKWRSSKQLEVAMVFLYRSGNDAKTMLLSGRMMIALLSVALGWVVYLWSRRLFGATGATISLILYTFSPTVLAHARLVTSDLAGALFFTLSVGALWSLLHRVDLLTLGGSLLAMSGLFLSKMSAVLVIPIGIIMLVLRLIDKRPVSFAIGKERQIERRSSRGLIFLAIVAVHIAVVVLFIWASHGFRYSMFHTPQSMLDRTSTDWNAMLRDIGFVGPAVAFLREHRLLPEGYLYGFAHVCKFSLYRLAFLNGVVSDTGWRWFFPYTLLVKTPLALFALLLLGLLGALSRWRPTAKAQTASFGQSFRKALSATAPLWILLIVYWGFSIASHLNIGHRHILPMYPVMFILCGGVGYWFKTRWRSPRAVLSVAVLALTAWFVVESFRIYPHYLAYFNQTVGGPTNGYKHLVDSSLDWGQDLPGLKRWLDRENLPGAGKDPVYLSYFGNGDPEYHGIDVNMLACWGKYESKQLVYPLRGGTYCISATMLQSVLVEPFGKWARPYEEQYQSLRKQMEEILALEPAKRKELIDTDRREWDRRLRLFDHLQLGRLCAYLRRREPDGNVGYSILIYRLTDAEVQDATTGPPVELVPEAPKFKKRWERG